MLTRIDDFFEFFTITEASRAVCQCLAAARASTMMDVQDYEALAALALHFRPRRIFEIGTHLGRTSDFFLTLLSECEVTSIAYEDPHGGSVAPPNNDSGLPRDRIGSAVAAERRSRFTQLYGDSHELTREQILREHGRFDLVFIDGDHSLEGVRQDTELAQGIIAAAGVICWHDANPNPMYIDVRRFLEDECPLPAIATKDEYVGGVAGWSKEIEDRLHAKTAKSVSAPGEAV